MTAEIGPLLVAGAQELGVPLDEDQRRQLLQLIAEVADWNNRFNLTAIREPVDMLRKHLLDSLSIQPHLHGQTIADIGTGAGFPGLPLAIANPHRHFTLVDSTAKKAKFVEHAAAALQLTNVTVANVRAESWKPPQRFDSVVSRALGSLQEFVRFAGHLCARDGRLLAMKGQYPAAELDSLPGGWRVLKVHPLSVPGLDAHRHLVELGANP